MAAAFSKIGQHMGRHKLAYGLGALGTGAAALFLGSKGSEGAKPQTGPSKDTYQSSQSTPNLGF